MILVTYLHKQIDVGFIMASDFNVDSDDDKTDKGIGGKKNKARPKKKKGSVLGFLVYYGIGMDNGHNNHVIWMLSRRSNLLGQKWEKIYFSFLVEKG